MTVAVKDGELAVQINGAWVYFRTLGAIQAALTDPFPGKIVVGDLSREDSLLASSYILNDQGGGFGVEIMDPKTQFDRFWDSTLWTLQRNQLILPPRAKNVGRGTVATSLDVTAGTQFQGVLYVAWGSDVRSISDSDVVSSTLTTLANDATDAISFNGKLLFAYGSNYTYFDGATWTTPGVAAPANYFATWDSKVWKITKNGTSFASSTDGVTWTAKAALTDAEPGDVRGLAVFFTPDNNLNLFAVTKRGLWVYDSTADVWRQTMFQTARHPYGGQAFAFHRDALYSSAGLSAYKFSGSSLSNVGLDREAGLPSSLRGNFVTFRSSQNWLLGLVDSSKPSPMGPSIRPAFYGGVAYTPNTQGYTALYLYNDRGWHYLWRSATVGRGGKWAYVGDAYNDYRLYWGSNGDLYYTRLSPNLHNPLQNEELQAWGFAPSGYLVTPWFGAGVEELEKTALRLRARGRHLSAEETITLSYGRDLDEAWTDLVTLTHDGRVEYNFANYLGQDFEYLRFKITLQRGADVSKTPTFIYSGLTFLKDQEGVWGLAGMLDCTQEYAGRSPQQQTAALEALAATRGRVPVQWRDDTGAIKLRYMKLSRLIGQEYAGPDGRGRWHIGFTEV